jgi:hypothetical protein
MMFTALEKIYPMQSENDAVAEASSVAGANSETDKIYQVEAAIREAESVILQVMIRSMKNFSRCWTNR